MLSLVCNECPNNIILFRNNTLPLHISSIGGQVATRNPCQKILVTKKLKFILPVIIYFKSIICIFEILIKLANVMGQDGEKGSVIID